MFSQIRKFAALLDRRARFQAGVLAAAVLIGAVLELGTLAMVYPFIGLVNDPIAALHQPMVRWMYASLGFASPRNFTIAVAVFLLALTAARVLYSAFLYDRQFKFVFENQRAIATRLLRSYFRQPYEFHLQRNSALMLRNLTTEIQNLFNNILIPVFYLLTDVALVIAMVGLLLFIRPGVALAVIVLLGGVMFFFDRVTNRKVKASGQRYLEHTGEMLKWANQGLGGVKEIKVLGRESAFLDAYGRHAARYADAARYYHTLFQLPRLMLEGVTISGMVLVALIMLLQNRNVQTVLPMLAVFTFAGLRLMPTLNRINFSLTSIRFFTPALNAIADDSRALEGHRSLPMPEFANRSLSFGRSIRFENVCFRYPNASRDAVVDITLEIIRGSVVAFVGASGSGKTTLVDILMGLLPPSQGRVCVDGSDVYADPSRWQRHIGYIPQTIYLIDDTIRRNVAFGIPDEDIDDDRVLNALAAAQLRDFVLELPSGLDTTVGDRGVRLSGGQRQRIVIARALYNNPDVLVLDEATSSLDSATEAEITRSVSSLAGEKTIIVISHRMSTVADADIVFYMNAGALVNSGSFCDVMNSIPVRSLTESQ